MFMAISTGKDETFGKKGENIMLHDHNLSYAIRTGLIQGNVEYSGDGRNLNTELRNIDKLIKQKKEDERKARLKIVQDVV